MNKYVVTVEGRWIDDDKDYEKKTYEVEAFGFEITGGGCGGGLVFRDKYSSPVAAFSSWSSVAKVVTPDGDVD